MLTSGVINAALSDSGIKLVADKGSVLKNRSYISLLVRKDHITSGRYKKFADLKGFKMAVPSFGGSSHEISTELFLKKGGLALTDISLLKMSYAEMNAGLEKNLIDATVQLEPYVTQAKLKGFAEVVSTVYDVNPGLQSAAIFYSGAFATKRPAVAQKFMTAYLRGVREHNAAFLENKHREETIQLLRKHVDITDDKVWQEMTPTGLDPDGKMNLESLRRDFAWYKEKNYLEAKNPDFEKVFDLSFARKAAASLKAKKK